MENKLLQELDYCVIDTETTGGHPYQDRIIEVAIVHWRDGIIFDRYSTLINPGIPIPPWITEITGINDEMVKNAPVFPEIARTIRSILDQGIFAAHNAAFDYGFIQGEYARMGEKFESPQICTLQLARRLFPELKSRSLGSLCQHFLIEIYDRHRAFGDAEATVYVLKNILKKLASDRRILTWGELQSFFEMGNLILPEGIDFATVASLPASSGSYILKDSKGECVFEGKTTNIRRRIQNHFAHSNRSLRSKKLRATVKSIELIPK